MMNNTAYEVNVTEEEMDNVIKFTRPALGAIEGLKEKTDKTAEELTGPLINALTMLGLKNQIGVVGVVSELAPVANEFFKNFTTYVECREKCKAETYKDLLNYMETADDIPPELKYSLIREMELDNSKDAINRKVAIVAAVLGISLIAAATIIIVCRYKCIGKVNVQKWKSLAKIAPKIIAAKNIANVVELESIIKMMK